MTDDFIEDKDTDMKRLWTPDPRSSLLSRIKHWWFPLLISLVIVLLIISLGALNAQSSRRLSSVESRVSELTSDLKSVNLSKQQEKNKEQVKQLQLEVEDHKTQLSSVSEALKQLAVLDSLSKSVTALKWTLEGIMNSSMMDGACPPGWDLFGTSCYFFSRLPLNWNQSRDWCQQQAAHLVILKTDEEWDFVTHLTVPQFHWVGLSDGRTGRWEWVNQTPYVIERRRWVPGQPDNWDGGHPSKGTEDCAHLHSTGRFNDMHCYITMRFVCQRPSRKM